MPIIPYNNPLPSWADPANKSVTDPLAISVIRKLVDLSGYGTPEGQLMGAAMPAPLISIYKTPAERMAANFMFNKEAGQMPAPIQNALLRFQSKYPRIAAHFSPVSAELPTKYTGGETMGAVGIPEGKVTKRLPMVFTKAGVAAAQKDPSQAMNTVFHEGNHVAQALGNSNLKDLNQAAEDLGGGGLRGYGVNPIEDSSVRAGNNAQYNTSTKPVNAARSLQELVNNMMGPGRVNLNQGQGPTREQIDAAIKIQQILQERALNGWSPTK